MPNYQTGHRQEPLPLSMHPGNVTTRAVVRLLTDEDERRSQLQKQKETIAQDEPRVRRTEERST